MERKIIYTLFSKQDKSCLFQAYRMKAILSQKKLICLMLFFGQIIYFVILKRMKCRNFMQYNYSFIFGHFLPTQYFVSDEHMFFGFYIQLRFEYFQQIDSVHIQRKTDPILHYIAEEGALPGTLAGKWKCKAALKIIIPRCSYWAEFCQVPNI